jgi:sodium/hydrogen antiporter
VLRALAEITLVLVLFSDASRVGLQDLRADLTMYLRLLGVGLPLTIALGTLLALALFGDIGGWLALLVGAALAPTDAALGSGMMGNPAAPSRIRRLINVESGLNDGIATSVVLFALAGAQAAQRGLVVSLGAALAELALGVVVGGAGGFLVNAARRRGWAGAPVAAPGVPALAVCAYASALWLNGNGFVAAFVAGLAFGAVHRRHEDKLLPFLEESASLVSLLVWLAIGAVAVVPAVTSLTWQTIVYAVLSLTLIRMVPVAAALAGTRLGPAATLFVAWFGPRAWRRWCSACWRSRTSASRLPVRR